MMDIFTQAILSITLIWWTYLLVDMIKNAWDTRPGRREELPNWVRVGRERATSDFYKAHPEFIKYYDQKTMTIQHVPSKKEGFDAMLRWERY